MINRPSRKFSCFQASATEASDLDSVVSVVSTTSGAYTVNQISDVESDISLVRHQQQQQDMKEPRARGPRGRCCHRTEFQLTYDDVVVTTVSA